MNNSRTWLKHLDFIIIDITSIIFSYVFAFVIYLRDFSYFNNPVYYSLPFLFSFCVFIFGFNEYSNILKKPNRECLMLNIKISFKTTLLILFILWAFKISESISRVLIALTAIIYVFIATIVKYERKKYLISKNSNIKNSLIIGNKGNKIADIIYNSKFNWNSLLNKVLKENINDLIVLDGITIPKKQADKLINNGITINIEIVEKYPFNIAGNKKMENTDNGDCIIYSMFEFTNKQYIHLFLKRLFDIFAGILGCVINIPLCIAIKIIYMASGDFSTIFYLQDRIGKNGKKFKLYKYRTMIPNAEEILKELLKDKRNKSEWEKNNKFNNDPRITKIGKILRKTSLDEFPQFINILIGNMSLVGPRPLVEGELESHTESKLYWRVKPGLTGWWGCNGRSNLDYQERLKLEYYYISNYSLELDFVCILKTIKAVFIADGAK